MNPCYLTLTWRQQLEDLKLPLFSSFSSILISNSFIIHASTTTKNTENSIRFCLKVLSGISKHWQTFIIENLEIFSPCEFFKSNFLVSQEIFSHYFSNKYAVPISSNGFFSCRFFFYFFWITLECFSFFFCIWGTYFIFHFLVIIRILSVHPLTLVLVCQK